MVYVHQYYLQQISTQYHLYAHLYGHQFSHLLTTNSPVTRSVLEVRKITNDKNQLSLRN